MVFDHVEIYRIWKHYFREYGKELENMERNMEKIWYSWRQPRYNFCLFFVCIFKQRTLIDMYSSNIFCNTVSNVLRCMAPLLTIMYLDMG